MSGAPRPSPWRLRGWAVLSLHVVETRTVRAFAPHTVTVVPIAPGRTLAALCFASYEDGSSLVYRELVVGAGPVIVAGRPAFWPVQLYVDNPTSVAAGRAVWALPKLSASFEVRREAASSRIVAYGERAEELYRISASRPAWRVPLRGMVPAVGLLQGEPLFFTGRLRARGGPTRATVEAAPGAELAPLVEPKPFLALAFDDLDLVVPPPYRKAAGASR